jgi:hypothetical protein
MRLMHYDEMREATLKRLFAAEGFQELAELWRADCLASGGTAERARCLVTSMRHLSDALYRTSAPPACRGRPSTWPGGCWPACTRPWPPTCPNSTWTPRPTSGPGRGGRSGGADRAAGSGADAGEVESRQAEERARWSNGS